MEYFIPRGTPVEIRQYGQSLCPHTTKRDLLFPQPVVSTMDEFVFHDGYWRIVVARALVSELPHGERQLGGTESSNTAGDLN